MDLLKVRKVFCSDMTFDATLNGVLYENGNLFSYDTEYDSWNMDLVAYGKRLFEM